VTKAELLDAIWPGIAVSDVVPTVCVQELRKVLGDPVGTPRFIETVPRRGYRFIAPVTTAQTESSKPKTGNGSSFAKVQTPELSATDLFLSTPLIGREAELAKLHGFFDKTIGGKRQVIFISGEVGIGKTAIVETFLKQLRSEQGPGAQVGEVWIGRGQCIEHHGEGEDFLPILDALRQLCRAPRHGQLIELLNRYAPTWLLQMPVPIEAVELEAARRRTHGLVHERMLWEIAETLEEIACEHPLVLWLEDLHWSDASTLALLSFLARRQEPARLLVIGTYRPVEVTSKEHPLPTLKQELRLHHYCEEIHLPLLSEDHVAEYLAMRFPEGTYDDISLQRLAHVVHQRTDGNPLFLVSVTDHISEARKDRQTPLSVATLDEMMQMTPESLLEMIEQQIARLTVEEQRVLEAASVVGVEFTAIAIAAGLEMDIVRVEEVCGELARREQFLELQGTSEWPDGSMSARFRFRHALCREVVYRRVTGARRVRLHRRIGEREESAYSDRAGEIALRLAMHFERGRDFQRAVKYLRQAAETAWRCGDYQEAERLFTKGLELLQTWPSGEERFEQELELRAEMAEVLPKRANSPGLNGGGIVHPEFAKG
jgi:predicted ATPase